MACSAWDSKIWGAWKLKYCVVDNFVLLEDRRWVWIQGVLLRMTVVDIVEVAEVRPWRKRMRLGGLTIWCFVVYQIMTLGVSTRITVPCLKQTF